MATKIESFAYLPVWVFKGTKNGKVKYQLVPPYQFEEAAKALNMNDQDKQKCLEFFSDTRSHLKNMQEVEK